MQLFCLQTFAYKQCRGSIIWSALVCGLPIFLSLLHSFGALFSTNVPPIDRSLQKPCGRRRRKGQLLFTSTPPKMTYITIIAIITQLYRFKRPTRYMAGCRQSFSFRTTTTNNSNISRRNVPYQKILTPLYSPPPPPPKKRLYSIHLLLRCHH